jgi:DNA-binding HxlR family transcriptional regulator
MNRDSSLCRSNCPINFVLETFGDKWTLLIVRDLMFKGKRRFGEFLESDEKIATNILTDRLKRLEEHEIVERSTSSETGARRSYQLTEKGKDLLPVMLEITAWSAKHDAKTNAPDEFLGQFAAARETLIASLKAALD